MTREDAIKIMSILRVAYPQFYKDMSRSDANNTIALWAEMFAEDDANAVAMAVKAIISTKADGFPPSIGQVKEKMLDLTNPEGMSVIDAWTIAAKAAAGNLEWEKIPPVVRRAIGSKHILKEWGMMEEDVFQSVIFSQFVRNYKAIVEEEKEIAKLPPDVRKFVYGIRERKEIPSENDEMSFEDRRKESIKMLIGEEAFGGVGRCGKS